MRTRLRSYLDRATAAASPRTVAGCLFLLVAVVMTLPVDRVDAAVVTSTGATDRMRCGFAAYDMSGSDGFVGKCYYQDNHGNTAAAFTAGSDVPLTGVSGTSRGYITACYVSSAPTRTCNWGSNAKGETAGSIAHVGPQTQYPYGFIPRGAVVFNVKLPTPYDFSLFQYSATPSLARVSPVAVDGTAYNDKAYNIAYAAPYDTYYWGGVLSSPAAAFNILDPTNTYSSGQATFTTPQCVGVTVTGPAFGTVAAPGSTQTFTVTRTGGSSVTHFGIRARVLGGSVTWAFNPWTSGTSFTVNVPTGAGTPVNIEAFEFRCSIDNGISYQYQLYGAPGSWFGFGVANRPCAQVTIAWPGTKADTYVVGEAMPFVASTPAGTSTVTLRYLTYNFPTAETPQLNSSAWTTWATLVGGTPQDLSIVAAFATTVEQVILRCEDAMGFYSGQTLTSGYTFSLYGTVNGTESCYDAAKIGANPVSWAPGLARMFICGSKAAATELLIPSSAAKTEFDDAWTSLAGRPPVSFIAEGSQLYLNMWGDASTAATAHRTDCLVILPESSVDGTDMAAGEVCPSTMGATFSGASGARAAVNVFVWGGWLWGMFQLVKKAVFKS